MRFLTYEEKEKLDKEHLSKGHQVMKSFHDKDKSNRALTKSYVYYVTPIPPGKTEGTKHLIDEYCAIIQYITQVAPWPENPPQNFKLGDKL